MKHNFQNNIILNNKNKKIKNIKLLNGKIKKKT
jgi:hypothetical protein